MFSGCIDTELARKHEDNSVFLADHDKVSVPHEICRSCGPCMITWNSCNASKRCVSPSPSMMTYSSRGKLQVLKHHISSSESNRSYQEDSCQRGLCRRRVRRRVEPSINTPLSTASAFLISFEVVGNVRLFGTRLKPEFRAQPLHFAPCESKIQRASKTSRQG